MTLAKPIRLVQGASIHPTLLCFTFLNWHGTSQVAILKPPEGRLFKIGVVYFGPDPSADACMTGLFGGLKNLGFVEGKNLQVRKAHAQGEIINIPSILQNFDNEDLDLIIPMATWVRPKLLLLDEHTAALDPKSADQVIRLTEDIVSRDKLTTLMVTHSMQQAASLGDRLVMMHRGQIIHDLRGAEKRRVRVDDLLARFEEVRRREQLDETAAEMLRQAYI